MISKATDEETNVEKLGSEGKLNRKTIIFTARIDEVIKMKSIGDVGVDDIKSDVAYVKEKEKQAQIAIVGPLTRSTNDRINLKLLREIDVKVGVPSNVISGCTILNNGKVLFSEYNTIELKDRVTLNDTNGNYILTVCTFSPFEGSLYGMTSIDTNTIAVYTGRYISIVNIGTQSVLRKIRNDRRYFGITHCDGKLYYCSDSEGIRRFDLKTQINQLLVPTYNEDEYLNISCDGNKLLYTSDTEAVTCCDMNGK